jgi:hypothetical protein
LVPLSPFTAEFTARKYVDRLGNQVHSVIQTLFLNNNAVFPDDVPIYAAGTVWFSHSWKSMKMNFNVFLPSTVATFEHH